MKVRVEFDIAANRFEATGNFDENMRYFIYVPERGRAWFVSKMSDICEEDCIEIEVGYFDSFSSSIVAAIEDDINSHQ